METLRVKKARALRHRTAVADRTSCAQKDALRASTTPLQKPAASGAAKAKSQKQYQCTHLTHHSAGVRCAAKTPESHSPQGFPADRQAIRRVRTEPYTSPKCPIHAGLCTYKS